MRTRGRRSRWERGSRRRGSNAGRTSPAACRSSRRPSPTSGTTRPARGARWGVPSPTRTRARSFPSPSRCWAARSGFARRGASASCRRARSSKALSRPRAGRTRWWSRPAGRSLRRGRGTPSTRSRSATATSRSRRARWSFTRTGWPSASAGWRASRSSANGRTSEEARSTTRSPGSRRRSRSSTTATAAGRTAAASSAPSGGERWSAPRRRLRRPNRTMRTAGQGRRRTFALERRVASRLKRVGGGTRERELPDRPDVRRTAALRGLEVRAPGAPPHEDGPAGAEGAESPLPPRPRLRAGERHLVEFVLNGERCAAQAPPRLLLSDFLRQRFGRRGVHVGCEHGVCGACTVRLDGAPARACLLFAVQVDGRRVDTVEGLAGPDGAHSPLQAAFRRHHALQCGYCTPGILMTMTEWLERLAAEGRAPDEDEVRAVLSGHLCRCTGYAPIVAAVLDAAAGGSAGTEAGAGGADA